MYSAIFLGLVSLILSLILTRLTRDAFLRIGVLDQPDASRKVHTGAIPRVGGIPLVIAFTASISLLLLSPLNGGRLFSESLPLFLRLVAPALVIFVTGLLDDLIQLRPWQKLFGQTTAALLAYFAGIQAAAFGGHHIPAWLSLPATVIWLVACANAVNLIDGVDGLASGVSLVATATMLVAAAMQHNWELAFATIPLVGALLGFLRYNFNPATIFLGDSGSLLVGFLLGCYGVLWSVKSATLLGMTAPIIALAIPLGDTALAILRRFLRGQPIFSADRRHIHHRLLARGLTPRGVALLLYGIGAVAAAFSLVMANNHFEVPVLVAFGIVTWLGVQRLEYDEFRIAARMVVNGAFRGLLYSQINLNQLEVALNSAESIAECWSILARHYREFGFCSLELRMPGGVLRTEDHTHADSEVWRMDVPLPSGCAFTLFRVFGDSGHSAIAPFVNILRTALSHQISSSKPSPEETAADSTWRVAGVGG